MQIIYNIFCVISLIGEIRIEKLVRVNCYIAS